MLDIQKLNEHDQKLIDQAKKNNIFSDEVLNLMSQAQTQQGYDRLRVRMKHLYHRGY